MRETGVDAFFQREVAWPTTRYPHSPHTKLGGKGRKGRKNNVLGKSPSKRLPTADFLGADKGIHRDGDGAIDVLRGAVLAETHFAEGFGDADYGFEVADLEWVEGWLVRCMVEMCRRSRIGGGGCGADKMTVKRE